MKATELQPEIQALVSHIKNWETQIRDEVATILHKLWNDEELTRSKSGLDVTPSELAAIWSVTNKTPIQVRHVREVKRDGRITPSEEWGIGSGYRCLYKVRLVKDVKVGHDKGRPRKRKAEAPKADTQLEQPSKKVA